MISAEAAFGGVRVIFALLGSHPNIPNSQPETSRPKAASTSAVLAVWFMPLSQSNSRTQGAKILPQSHQRNSQVWLCHSQVWLCHSQVWLCHSHVALPLTGMALPLTGAHLHFFIFSFSFSVQLMFGQFIVHRPE